MGRYFRSYKRKNVRRLGRRKVAARRRTKPSKFLKRTIQKMISKNIEDKDAYHSSGDSVIWFNSGIDSGGDVQKVLPSISQGSTEQHRIGEIIRAKTLVIKGHIQLKVNTDVNNMNNKRVGVRLMVVGHKRYKQWDDLAGGGWLGALLKKGSTSTSFTGTVSDLYAPLNDAEVIKYYDRIHYLSQSYTAQQVGSSTPTVQWSVDTTRGLKLFTIRIPVRGKKLQYDSSTGGNNQPTNWTCGLLLGYAHMDASSADTVSTNVGLCYDSYFEYEDA